MIPATRIPDDFQQDLSLPIRYSTWEGLGPPGYTEIFPTRTFVIVLPAGLHARRGKSKRALPFGRLNEGMDSGEGEDSESLPLPGRVFAYFLHEQKERPLAEKRILRFAQNDRREDWRRFLALNVAQSFRLNSGGTSTKRCAIVSTQFLPPGLVAFDNRYDRPRCAQ